MATRRLVQLRRALLALFVLLVGAVVGLFVFGRADVGGVAAGRAADSPPVLDDSWDQDVAVKGEGFEFALVQEGRTVFRIRGDQTRSDRQDNVFLEQAKLFMPRDDGDYDVASETATYNKRSYDAKLEGNVVVNGPRGLELRTAWLDLQRGGKLLVASTGTRFGAGQRLVGRAENLRIDLERDVMLVSGGVEMESLPGAEQPFTLHADRVLFDKRERVLRAEGNVVMDRGADHLEAERLTFYLDAELREVGFMRALYNVKGRMVPTVEPPLVARRVQFQGMSLSLLFAPDGGGAQKVELEGHTRLKAVMNSIDAAGSELRLASVYLAGNFEGGVLTSADAIGPLSVVEKLVRPDGGQDIRTAVARRGEARFDVTGGITGFTLDGEVVLKQARLESQSERAVLDLAEGRIELFGKPVSVTTERGDLRAPRVTYNRESGLLHAVEQVRAELDQDGAGLGFAKPLMPGDDPVRIEATEAFLRDGDEGFLFRGSVRAWQGKNLLLAEQLRGEAGNRLSASGGVRTTWHPSADAEPAVVGAATSPAGAPHHAPVEITAQHMTFGRGDGLLIFNGKVQADQAGRLLSCDEMTIELEQKGDGKAERLHCRGHARLIDPVMGRTITGERAVYHLGPGEVEIFGDPLTVQDPQRARIQGRQLRYRLEDGQFWMGGAGRDPQSRG